MFGDCPDSMEICQLDSAVKNVRDLMISSGNLTFKLKSTLPPAIVGALFEKPSSTTLTIHDFDSVYYKILVFLTSNNFPGLDEKGVEAVFKPLHGRSYEQLETLFHLMIDSTKMIFVENLFFHAIKVGAEGLVEALLTDQSLGIDPNKEISLSVTPELKYNPLILSCKHKQGAVVKVLLRHDAQIERVDGACYSGILGLVIENCARFKVDVQLIRQLLEADASVHLNVLDELLRQGNLEILQLLTREPRSHECRKWHQAGFFHRYIWQVGHGESGYKECTRIMDLMSVFRLDLNFRHYVADFGSYTAIIDIIARHGYIPLIRRLLQSGPCVTTKTLINAIKSENMELINFLLDHGADINTVDSNSTPFAEAIRTGNLQLTRALAQRGALRHIKRRPSFQAAICAASAMGNLGLINALLAPTKHALANKGGILRSGLDAAIKAGHKDVALLLIHTGMEVTENQLHLALSMFESTLAQALLDAGVVIVDQAGDSKPLLRCAINLGNHSLVSELITRGAYVKKCYNDLESPLLAAIRMQNKALVTLLINAGAIIDETYKGEYLRNREEYQCDGDLGDDLDGFTSLAEASYTEDIEMVRHLLAYGAEPNDSVALSVAILLNNEKVVELLLQGFSGKNPQGTKCYSSLALIAAAEIEDASWTKMIVDRVDATAFCTFREIRSLKGLCVEFNRLFPDDCLECSKYDKVTPLGYIIWRGGHESMANARLLLERGINPNDIAFLTYVTDDSKFRNIGKTALQLAISKVNILMIQLVLEFDADINKPVTNSFGRTPLQQATEEGNLEVVQFLLINGAHADDQPARKGGGTALQLAAIRGYLGIALLLLDNGANVNAAPSEIDGRTALEGAAEWGRLDMVKLLLKAGFDIKSDAGRQYYKTARYLARENGHETTLELLKSCDPDPEPRPTAVFTDKEGWTFWGVETDDGFEAWEGEVPVAQDTREIFGEREPPVAQNTQEMFGEGSTSLETVDLNSQDSWWRHEYL